MVMMMLVLGFLLRCHPTLHTTCLSGLWALGSGLWVHYIDHYYNITVYQSSTIKNNQKYNKKEEDFIIIYFFTVALFIRLIIYFLI